MARSTNHGHEQPTWRGNQKMDKDGLPLAKFRNILRRGLGLLCEVLVSDAMLNLISGLAVPQVLLSTVTTQDKPEFPVAL